MQVFASDIHRLHDPLELSRGTLGPSTEAPKRAELIKHALQQADHTFLAPAPLDRALLERVHSVDYLAFLEHAWARWEQRYGSDTPAMPFTWPSRSLQATRPEDLVGQLGYYSFSADSSIVAGTWTAVVETTALAASAASAVAGGAPAAYALCRPPGHHATRNQFGGYCFLNNSAIAAERLRDGGHECVAVLDVDYHHGNGTQDIFYARSDVLTVSIHADPLEEFPWFAGHAKERGRDDGHGWNLNLPLARGSTLKQWNATLDLALEAVASSGASALVVPLGVDTYLHDPLGTFALDTHDYATAAERIRSLNLPTVIVQEGGYAAEAIGRNVVAFLDSY